MTDYDQTDIPERYSEARHLPQQTIDLWMSILEARLPIGSVRTVVDLGCGNGRFSAPLAALYGALVIGIDPSDKMLAEAAAGNRGSGVEFRSGSAESIPVPDGAAELVFLSQSYHHIADIPRARAEIARILTPTGTLCIRNSTIETLSSSLYLRFFPTARDTNPARLPARQDLIDAVTAGHFRLVLQQTVTQEFAEDHLHYAEKIGLRALSDLARIPDQEFEAGMSLLREHCRSAPADKPVYDDIDLFLFTHALG